MRFKFILVTVSFAIELRQCDILSLNPEYALHSVPRKIHAILSLYMNYWVRTNIRYDPNILANPAQWKHLLSIDGVLWRHEEELIFFDRQKWASK